jgi:transposase
MRVVGIDVGKDSLDLAILDGSHVRTLRVANTPAGIAAAVTALAAAAPLRRVVLEATGAYHMPLLAALLAAHLPTSLVNPAQVAAFRRTLLVRNKTDRQDAILLARFAQTAAEQLRLTQPSAPLVGELRALVGYREQLVRERTRLLGQQEAANWQGNTQVQQWLAADLAQVEARLGQVEQHLTRLLADLPEAQVMLAMTGVGLRVAAAVLAYLPVGVWGDAKAAACAGVHPRQVQSGRTSHSRLSKTGSHQVRRSLDMAALVAIRHDARMRA